MRKALALSFALILTLILASCVTAKDETLEIENSALALAQAYAAAGQGEEALRVYDKALEEIQSPKILYNKMLCLAFLERWDEADKLGIEAEEAYPYFLIFPQARIEFFKKQGKTESAIQIAKEILEKDPYNQEVSSALLELLISSEQTEEAQDFARLMLRREVSINEAKNFLFPVLALPEEEQPKESTSSAPENPVQEPENDLESKNTPNELEEQEEGSAPTDYSDWINPPFPEGEEGSEE